MTYSSACSSSVPATIRRRGQLAIAGLPGPGGTGAAEYPEILLAGMKKVAAAWGGVCLSSTYKGHQVPLDLRCAAGHRFPLLASCAPWTLVCRVCPRSRNQTFSGRGARDCHRLGRRLSLASLHQPHRQDAVALRGGAHMGGMPGRGALWRLVPGVSLRAHQAKTGGYRAGCARARWPVPSAYVDKETPPQWQCAKGHTWFAPWCRVNKGQWCHQCAVKARTRTIEQMQELARSRGGQCLSTVYPGTHGKIEWLCGKGYAWHANVNSVWRGSWCPECAHEYYRIARTQGRHGKRVPILV
jgi:hypothetical protein